MSWKKILECLRTGEDEFTEFISFIESTEHILQYIIAFLNNKGGKLVVGIDDKNDHLLGSNVSLNFIETAIQKIEPHIHIDLENIIRGDKSIVFIKVPEGRSKPYSYNNKFYVRKNKTIEKLKKEELFPIGMNSPIVNNNNKRQIKILELLIKQEKITNRQYRDIFKVSHKTAHLELTDLLKKGVLDKVGMGRNTAYVLVN
jgi:predicted HTH transcriptional regulator